MKAQSVLRISKVAVPAGIVGALAGYVSASRGYTVDWPATGAMVQGWAALLAAGAAAWGVNRWQQELRYKRNSELAEKIMVALEGLVTDMESARGVVCSFEIDARVGSSKVLTSISYQLRLNLLTSGGHAAELATMLNRVSAIFGPGHRVAIEDMMALHNLIRQELFHCIGMASAVDQGRLDVECLFGLERHADTLLPDGTKGAEFTQAINMRAEAVRNLFRGSM